MSAQQSNRAAVITAPVAPSEPAHAPDRKTTFSCGICDRLRFNHDTDRDALIALGVPRICRLCNGWCLQ
jgi:hypothetical protein